MNPSIFSSSLGLALFFCCWFLAMLWVAQPSPNAQSLWQQASLHSLPSPFTWQPRRFLGLLLRGIFLFIGLLYAIQSLQVEWRLHVLFGEPDTADAKVYKLHDLSLQFPPDHTLRRLPAALAGGMSEMMSARHVSQEIDFAILNDPYVHDLQAQHVELMEFFKAHPDAR